MALTFFVLLATMCLSSNHLFSCTEKLSNDDIETLQKDRRQLLADAFDEMYKVFLLRQAVSLHELVQAERDVLKADLERLVKTQERIKALEEHKMIAEKIVKTVEVKVAAGRAIHAHVLQAKAYVLEVQIELLKVRKKQKAKPSQ